VRWCCAAAPASPRSRISAPAIGIFFHRKRAGSSPGSGSPMTASKNPAVLVSPIAETVREGLSAYPKHLPPKLFYDAQGCGLFEQITETREYYPTRTERTIFREYVAEMAEHAGNNLTLVELGAGSARKTRLLIEALLRRQLRLDFYPVDVSPTAL